MVGSIVLLLLNEDSLKKFCFLVFLNIGIAVAFFDLMTYPIVTFGVPMLVYLMLTTDTTLSSKLMATIENGITWSLGYGGFWVSKWVIATKILGWDVVADGIGQFTYRSSGSEQNVHIPKLWMLGQNFAAFFKTPVTYFTIAVVVIMVYAIILARKDKKKTVKVGHRASVVFMYLLVGCAPIVWYIFATNHSAIHSFFTNKSLVVLYLAVLFALASLLETKAVTENSERVAKDA